MPTKVIRILSCLSGSRDLNITRYTSVRPMQASPLGCNSFSARDFEKDVWSSPFHGLRFSKEQVEGWHAEDLVRNEQLSRSSLEDSTEQRDAVFIKGGEFFGCGEFRLLRSRSRCFFLDDAFHAFKEWNNRHIFLVDTACKLVKENLRLRNGYSIICLRLPWFWGWV